MYVRDIVRDHVHNVKRRIEGKIKVKVKVNPETRTLYMLYTFYMAKSKTFLYTLYTFYTVFKPQLQTLNSKLPLIPRVRFSHLIRSMELRNGLPCPSRNETRICAFGVFSCSAPNRGRL